MKRKMTVGIASVALPIFVVDSSSSIAAGLGSLAYNTAGLVAEYRRQGQSSWTAITLVAGTLGTYTSGGFVADGSLAGSYEFCPPNAAFAAGSRWAAIRLYGAANMKPVLIEIELDAVDYQDSVRAGLSALPNAAANAAGGLLSYGTGTGQLNPSGGKIPATLSSGDVSGNLPTDAYGRIGANGAGLTALGDTRLANLDATVSSRMAGSAYTAPPSAATVAAAVWADTTGAAVKASTDKIPANPAAVGSAMQLDLSQVVPPADVSALTTMTVGHCLAGARAGAAGAESIVSTTYLVKNPDGSTYRTFTLNDAVNPTARA